MRGNCLQHSHSVTFPSVHSQFHSHDASHLIPIPVPLPEFIPIPSHCHSRLTNERPLSLNNQTTINVKKQTFNCFSLKNRNSKSHIVSYRWIIKMRTFKMQKKDVTLQHFIGLHFRRVDRWEFWHTWKSVVYSSHFHLWHICVPIPVGFPRESNSHASNTH